MLDSSSSSDDDFLTTGTRRPRRFKPRINFDYSGIDSECRFRLNDAMIEKLITEFTPYLRHQTERNYALSPRQQILVALRFFATGDNFRTIGDAHGIHKSTVSRSIQRVVSVVNEHYFHNIVKWPENQEDLKKIHCDFRAIAGIPTIFGCVDGTHVQFKRPSENEVHFVNRHGKISLNVMLICGPNMEFFYVDSKWPGSVNDARVLRRSGIKTRLESGWRPFPNAVLLGDSIYPCNNYIIPPVPLPMTGQEERFNVAHKKTRRIIECAIGILKQRFRCLLHHLELSPVNVAHLVYCCTTLHNMCLANSEHTGLDDVDDAESMESEQQDDFDEVENTSRRSQLIALF